MLKKTITYTDYNGNERTEDFYFNLNKAEITEWEVETPGGYSEFIKKIVQEVNGKEIIELFKRVILKSYGEKSPDGKRFIKSKELTDAFSQTEAFVELFMELATNAEAAAAFVNSITPPVPQQPSLPEADKKE